MSVLDASFLIAVERGQAEAVALAQKLAARNHPLWIPAVAWLEFLAGVAPAHHANASQLLADLGSCVAFDRPLAEGAARLQQVLLRRGLRMPWNDLQVAATALHLGEPLVSLDGGFDEIPGLEVVRP